MSEEEIWNSVIGATIVEKRERRNDWTGADEISLVVRTTSGKEFVVWASGGLSIEEPDETDSESKDGSSDLSEPDLVKSDSEG